jgi:hypothetical protein
VVRALEVWSFPGVSRAPAWRIETMQIKYMVAALCCASLMAGFAACGGDDDDDSSAAGPCEQFCPVAVDEDCYDDLDACTTECNASLALLPASCQSELDDYVSCMETASDVICGTVMPLEAASCDAEGTAVFLCATGGGTGGTSNEGGSGNESGAPAARAGAGGAN